MPARTLAPRRQPCDLCPANSRSVHANAKGLSITYLNCPHCGLTITPKADWLLVEHCPRCIARRGILVTLFASSLPADVLYGADSRPDPDRSESAGPNPAPTT